MAQSYEDQTDALLIELKELHYKIASFVRRQAVIVRRLDRLRDLQGADDRFRGIVRTPPERRAETPPSDHSSTHSDDTTAETAVRAHRVDEATRVAAREELRAAAAYREQQAAQPGGSTTPTAASPEPTPPEPQRAFRVGQKVRIKNPRRFQASTGTVSKITAGRIHVKTANGSIIQRSPDNVVHA